MNCGRRQERSGHVGSLKGWRLTLKSIMAESNISFPAKESRKNLQTPVHFWNKQFQINLNMKPDPAYSAPWRKLGKFEMNAGKIYCRPI